MAMTIDELKANLDQKLDAMSGSVETKCLDALRKETKEFVATQFDALKKERTFEPGDHKPDKWARVKCFSDFEATSKHPGTGYVSWMSEEQAKRAPSMQSWSPEFVRAFGGWCKAVYIAQNHGNLPEAIAKALGEADLSTGGALIPIQFQPELLRLIIEGQFTRPGATIFQMATDILQIPRIRDITHATSVHGGMKGTWTKEGGTVGTGDPTFGQVKLEAKKFTESIPVANELIMDSPITIPALLGVLGKEALGFWEDVSSISGTGAGEMMGWQNATCAIVGGGNAAGTGRLTTNKIKYGDVLALYSRMLPSALNDAVWVCSPACFPEIAQMSVAVGTGGSAVWITNYTTAAGAPPATILGRPLYISEKVPTLGSQGDLSFVARSYYLIGDRMQLSIQASEHYSFLTDQTQFRMIERLDGQPWMEHDLTPKNGGATLSPFVLLGA